MSAHFETRTVTRPTGNRPVDAASANTAAADSHAGQRRWVALGLLVSAQFVVMLDTSIVNVALPSIQSDMGLSTTAITWVVNAYVLAFGGLLLLSGRAADLLGRRRMFVAGSAVFAVGTLFAAFATNEGLLVGGRIVQGVGAAALSRSASPRSSCDRPSQPRCRCSC